MSKISFVSVIFPSLVEKSEISNILISVQRKYFCIFIDILALRNLLQLLLQTCLICLVQTQLVYGYEASMYMYLHVYTVYVCKGKTIGREIVERIKIFACISLFLFLLHFTHFNKIITKLSCKLHEIGCC